MKDFNPKNSSESKFNLRSAVVASLYHKEITSELVAGAVRELSKHSPQRTPDIFWVPGAYELPQAVHLLAKSRKYDALVPVGCVIRGETAHFDYISRAVSLGLDAVGRSTGIAVSFGVLTVDSVDQARDRAGGKWGNKGEEAALAAVELVKLRRKLVGRGKPKKSA